MDTCQIWIFYKLYKNLWREIKFKQKCGLQSKESIFSFSLFYWILYDFSSLSYWMLKQKWLFLYSITQWRKIVQHRYVDDICIAVSKIEFILEFFPFSSLIHSRSERQTLNVSDVMITIKEEELILD